MIDLSRYIDYDELKDFVNSFVKNKGFKINILTDDVCDCGCDEYKIKDDGVFCVKCNKQNDNLTII